MPASTCWIVDAPGRDRGSRQLPRVVDDYLPLGPALIEEDPPRDLLSALLRLFLRG
jgi:hypothetical protein